MSWRRDLEVRRGFRRPREDGARSQAGRQRSSSVGGQRSETFCFSSQTSQSLLPSGVGQSSQSFVAGGQPCSPRVGDVAHPKPRFASWEGKGLWLCLRALEFDPETASSCAEVGPMMFEIPNNPAFHVIACFLFAKLDKRRAIEDFGDCSLPEGVLTAAEFKKKCCIWLREIANEDKSQFPQFAPSVLLCPGGPTFIHLMYCFARHAVLEDMKRNSLGTDIPFAEALKLAPTDVNVASARCRVASSKLLQILQKENLVVQEYYKENQLLIKEIEKIKSEYKVLQLKSSKMKQNDQNDKIERIQKVRSTWTGIMEIFTSLTKEKEAVDYVLQGCVGKYVLGEASGVLRIPQLLVHRIESDIHQHWSGDLYKAGKLNFLLLIQLLNEALRTLRDETSQSGLTPKLAYIKDIHVKFIQTLNSLESIRLVLKPQHYVSRSESISREQEDWEEKWKNFLGLCPVNLMLEPNPLCLLRASAPCSSHPLEDGDDDSVFYEHLLLDSDICKPFHEVRNEKVSDASSVVDTATTSPGWWVTTASGWVSSVPLELSKACENSDASIEKNLPVEACKGHEMPVSPETFKQGKDDFAISEESENTGDPIPQTDSPVKKEGPLKESSDELAEEIARTVVSESPQSDEDKGKAFEDILSSLVFNPFLSRKEISRTPENLVTELRSSRRKAVQHDDPPSAKVMREEAPEDAGPIMQVVADSRLMCSAPASPIADSDLSLSERKSLLCSKVKPQNQMRISHVIESPLLEIAGLQETERTGEQELKCFGNISLQRVSSGEDQEESSTYMKSSVNTLGGYLGDNSIIKVPPLYHFQDSSMDRMLNQNISPLLSSVSRKSCISWIMDETFPEYGTDTTEFARSDSVCDGAISDVTGKSKTKGDTQESKLDLQSLLNPREALKKTASTSEEELHQAHDGGESVSCTSDKNLKPGKRDELFSPPVLFSLDDAFIKTPSPASPNERQDYLSSLLSSCRSLEEVSSRIHDLPLSLITKLKEKELLNDEPGTKEPSSGQNS